MTEERTAFDEVTELLVGRVYRHKTIPGNILLTGSHIVHHPTRCLFFDLHNLTYPERGEYHHTFGELNYLTPISPLNLTENEAWELALWESEHEAVTKKARARDDVVEQECNNLRLERALKGYPMRDSCA